MITEVAISPAGSGTATYWLTTDSSGNTVVNFSATPVAGCTFDHFYLEYRGKNRDNPLDSRTMTMTDNPSSFVEMTNSGPYLYTYILDAVTAVFTGTPTPEYTHLILRENTSGGKILRVSGGNILRDD